MELLIKIGGRNIWGAGSGVGRNVQASMRELIASPQILCLSIR